MFILNHISNRVPLKYTRVCYNQHVVRKLLVFLCWEYPEISHAEANSVSWTPDILWAVSCSWCVGGKSSQGLGSLPFRGYIAQFDVLPVNSRYMLGALQDSFFKRFCHKLLMNIYVHGWTGADRLKADLRFGQLTVLHRQRCQHVSSERIHEKHGVPEQFVLDRTLPAQVRSGLSYNDNLFTVSKRSRSRLT